MTRDANRVNVAVRGEADVYSAPLLHGTLADLVTAGNTDIVVDMSRVSYIDSTGLAVLVSILKQVRQRGGSLALRGLTPLANQVFELTGLFRVFSIEA